MMKRILLALMLAGTLGAAVACNSPATQSPSLSTAPESSPSAPAASQSVPSESPSSAPSAS